MHTTLRSAIVAALLLSFLGCLPTRFMSYRPPGSNEAWPIKLDWSVAEDVVIAINGEKVVKGVFPFMGTREFTAKYRGHDVKMVLNYDKTGSLYINGDMAGQFNWKN